MVWFTVKRNSSKVLGEVLNNQKKTPDDILKSGEINTSEESVNLYMEICGYAGVKIEIISGLIFLYLIEINRNIIY